jgi:gliding motility-associated-like protein
VYVLTVTDAGGCKGRDTVRVIYLRCDDTELLIPNVFSPNGDRVNDLFDIKGECLHSKFLIQIFNRWGVKVFETTDRYNSWDGRINGGPEAVDGVYYYVIDIDKTTYTGFVQIVR